MYFENSKNSGKTLDSRVILKKMEGLKLRKPYRDNIVEVKLEPG